MIIAMLTCVDTAAAIEFCKRAFGATLLSERMWRDGKIIHATPSVGDALLWFMAKFHIWQAVNRSMTAVRQ